MRWLCTIAVLVVTIGISVPAAAESNAREHDGFFLQMQYGGGVQDLSADSYSMSIGGASTGLRVALGGTPVTNLVIFGEVFALIAPGPTVEFGAQKATADDASLNMTMIGPGVGYYFGESSYFVSGSLGLTQVELEGPGISATASGLGWRLGGGKEWWVSDQWGLGIAANLSGAAIEDEINDEFTSTAFTLNFSATLH